ncbi:putative ubiquitin-conjugating enzyme protein [Rosellinia necatrix]|uniref:Putative ubiquitin-conjugating enzyme protein n=1 Tax=Rosellinia necatrix TaxID=77044 RepID=A0A1W2TFI5_ROSNE|nr:putative ubiquitin-conjugating enzyme protein [Rosellinia necatrix]
MSSRLGLAPRPGPTPRKFMIPAQDSRHRIACLALYRTLLRLAPQVSLPPDLAEGWGSGKNPIAIHIRRAFRRNVADTSVRIVQPALRAGYRMISVLQPAAASTSSDEHHQITSFLRGRLEERQRSLANRPSQEKPKPGTPRPGYLPLLVNVTPAPTPSNPNPRPRYDIPHRPRPQSELGGTGRRKIPRLDMASEIPFLRFSKPQPVVLSRVLGGKVRRRSERAIKVGILREEALPEARLEDQWERAMARLAADEASKRGVGIGPDRNEPLYAHTIQEYGIRELNTILTKERLDLIARAEAMSRLIQEEKALAAEEAIQRAADKRARWEARMLDLHGEAWRDLFPNLKESGRGRDGGDAHPN